MPFNDKGEFIRSSRRSTPAAAPASSGPESISREDLITIAKGLVALVLLAALIWAVVVFREWIAIGLMLWVVSSLRNLLH